jgi:alpha-N-acetylglucosaminidase
MLCRAVCLAVFALSTLGWSTPQEDAAKGVLQRLVGKRSASFSFQQISQEKGLDVFEVSATNGKVAIKGSTGVAMSRGAYEYLRKACHRQVTWDNWKVTLPAKLPDMKPLRVNCPNKYRHYLNACTFGYTMTWWKWDRWQREIDWMALHGINMPLAMTGQEAIWQKVFLDLGVKKEDVHTYFTGPAFLPWQRMGNCSEHAGPLPQSWIDSQVVLQKQILQRERELGMTPVIQGFSGFVPKGFTKVFPQAKIRQSTAWAGFKPTFILDAGDPLFQEVGKRYIQEYTKVFGTDHLYLCDTFNEMRPQVNPATKLEELKALGDSVYKTILAGDPQGIWVMQGWLFLNDREFWGQKEAEAMLSAVPDDRMIILDLAAEMFEGWRAQPAMKKKQWIWCILHNFGQATPMYGSLQQYADASVKALEDPEHGNMVGMGTTPEGIEQNAVVYELVTDMMWGTKTINVGEWIKDYAHARYGTDDPEVLRAWSELYTRYYLNSGSPTVYIRRPSMGAGLDAAQGFTDNKKLTERFLNLSDRLASNPAYLHDLVDIEKRYLESVGSLLLDGVYSAYDDGKPKEMEKAVKAYFGLLDDLDLLLATRPEYRLSRWTDAARSWGTTPAEKDLYEQNARLQVTVWGSFYLYDYASKEWAGLTTSFYKERWRHLFDAMKTKPYNGDKLYKDLQTWELDWCMKLPKIARKAPKDTVAVGKSLFAKYKQVAVPKGDAGIAVGAKVTDSGHIESSHSSSLITDGIAFGDYWSAFPYPQWVQIDLGAVRKIGSVHLFPYYAEPRYYQYSVEVSRDGKTWTVVADKSQNTTPATRKGDRLSFKATEARYVRVNMLLNSANNGVHLHEVRVFEAK